jgi:putative ABC transport system permease protein
MNPPPGSRLAARVLGRILAPRKLDYLLGDLLEEYRRHILPERGKIRATLWYWQQVVRSIPSSASSAKRTTRKGDGYIMNLLHDVRFAIRSLIKTPGFTAIAVLTLALGIGANTTIFSVVQTVLLRPLPYDEPDRIVQVYETNTDRGWNTVYFSHPNFWDFKEQNSSFEQIAAMTRGAMNLTGFEYPERLSAGRVTVEFFRVLRMDALYGRTFLPGEDQPESDTRVALLGNGLWRRRFGGEPEVVGRTITLDGEPHTVVGVLPTGNPFPGLRDVYVPLVRGSNTRRDDKRLFVIGRIKAGVTAEAALADMEAVAAGLRERYPDDAAGLGVRIRPSEEWIASSQIRTALWMLMGAVGFLLMIACVNLANLLLARATGRQRELAVCAALGATRKRLTSRALTESLMLGLTGAMLGVGLSLLGMRLVQAFNPDGIPRIAEIGINQWVLGFTLIVAVATGVLTGLVPGLQMPYGNLLTVLRYGDRGIAGNRRQRRTRSVLVGAETALSLVLLVGAGLLIRSFGGLQRVDRGFDSENRVTFQVSLPGSYTDAERSTQFLKRFLSRVHEIPQVQAAGAVSMQPLGGSTTNTGMVIEERIGDEQAIVLADWRYVTPDYFRSMGIAVVRGRNFTERDRLERPYAVIISEPLAERLWPGEDPIGRRAAVDADPELMGEIIGVVGGMRERGLQSDPTLAVYLPYYGDSWSPVNFVVHTAGNPGVIVPNLRTVLAEIDPNLPISNIATLDDLVDTSVAGNRFNMLLLGVFAAVALLLALAGIYGVLAYSVTRRTSEIGVRVALGASHGSVLREIVLQGMRPVAIGIAIGLAGALGLSRFLATLLFGIAPTDPMTYAGVAVLLAVAALAACYMPARRALQVDPVTALREE